MNSVEVLLSENARLKFRLEELSRVKDEVALLRLAAIAEAQAIVEQYDLLAAQVFPPAPVYPAPKRHLGYRDPSTGETWSGEGEPPRWVRRRMAKGLPMDEVGIPRPATPARSEAALRLAPLLKYARPARPPKLAPAAKKKAPQTPRDVAFKP